MPEERTYIDDIVSAIFRKENHRKLVLKEAERRIAIEINGLFKKILAKKTEKRDWWKNELILNNPSKDELIWFGGLNSKTIFNILGTTKIDECRKLCAENYDVIINLVKELPEEFPKPTIVLSWKGKKISLTENESFMLVRSLMAMVKTITGGIWSEVGKQAGDKFLKKLFEKLGIPEGPLYSSPLGGAYYVLNVEERGRSMDAVVYFKNQRVLGIEIKILGAGNPEIVDEAISRLGRGDVFLVGAITDLMRRKTEEKGITVCLLKDAPEGLYSLLKEKGLPVKQP